MIVLVTVRRVSLFHLEEYEAAKQALEEGQGLDPSNKQYKPWIRKCQAELDGERNPAWDGVCYIRRKDPSRPH